MAGHYHANDASLTQNQGNTIGDRPCVRQSRLYREHNGGNAMKNLLGQDNLAWDTTQQQGAYQGQQVHGPASQTPSAGAPPPPSGAQPAPAPYAMSNEAPQQPMAWNQGPPPQQQGVPQPYAQQSVPYPGYQAQPQQQQVPMQPPMQQPPQQQQQQQPGPSGHQGRPGAGQANRTTYNFMTGQ